MLNVWKMFPARTYYLKHPIKFIEDKLYSIKYAWQRTCRGYADIDLFNMDQFLLELLPQMLDDLAKTANGYPCSEQLKFSSHEDWKNHLKAIAIHLRNADEELCPEKNQYEDTMTYVGVTETKHEDGTVSIVSNAPEELRKNYWNRLVEIERYREKEICKAFDMLSPVFFALWD